ncbi:hypothetical protein Pla175_50270 [Pirellulimonas nuda]|uniref:Uncharacterized protein n=1 Tax=Pirellulimonas nuda TaxID=2528009 RepID=A0A518DJE4_9BACT|nr:hypothetical protein [Pirellulimonas nuda]QDU91597.1 hypothetical protein Pla175_50270 [Pirellulimonas nuda]
MRFGVFDLLLLTTIVALVAGAWGIDPGLGVTAAIVAVPVSIRSWLVFNARAKQGIETSPRRKALMVLLSAAITIVLLTLALFVAVFAFCSVSTPGPFFGGPREGGAAWQVFAAICAIVAVGVFVWLTVKLVRFRWRRDTKK